MQKIVNLPPGIDGTARLHTYSEKVRLLHWHKELELSLVTRGTVDYLAGERRYTLTRGALLWLFPAHEHVLLRETRDCEMWILVFNARLLRRACTTAMTRPLLKRNPAMDCCKQILEHQAARLSLLFAEIAGLQEDAASFNAALAHGLLTAWRTHVADESVIPGTDVHPAVERAANLMNREIEPLSTRELASRSGLSLSRLRRLFKTETGISMVEYRNRQRLQRFLQLYGRGRRRKMLDAAFEAGFGSYPQFHRVFKELMGYGPAEHRRRVSKP